jgi:PAS domain S-box-containing protein
VDYTQLLDRLPAITYIADTGAGGRWHYVSPQIKEILGFSPQEWTASPTLWAERLHPDDRQWVLDSESLSAAGDAEVAAAEYRMVHRDGHGVWIRDDAVLLEVVAEGVETQRQANALAQLGCRIAQGFHFSRPVPAHEISAMLLTGPRWLAAA